MARIIQIGTGGWGKNHTRILSQMNSLVAVCDTDNDRIAKVEKEYSVRGYNSINDIIEKEEFDAAFVCTPTKTHADITTTLLKAKKHVFVEKPLTYNSKDGQMLLELAQKNNVLLTCGYVERFNPAVGTIKDLIKSKKYGEPIMLEFHRESKMPPHIKDVGIIYDTSVHDIDTATWLFDSMPNMVFARAGKLEYDQEVYTNIILGFENNKTAVITSNWITPVKVRTFSAVFKDIVTVSDFLTQEIQIKKNDSTEIPQREKAEPLLLEIQNFIEAVDGKSELIVKPQQAVNITHIAEAALLSSQKGIPIYLELT